MITNQKSQCKLEDTVHSTQGAQNPKRVQQQVKSIDPTSVMFLKCPLTLKSDVYDNQGHPNR